LSKESKRTLEVPERSLGGFDIRDVPRIHQGSYISIFRFLSSWEVVLLLGSPERNPRSLRGRWSFLRGVLVVFDIRDVPRIHQ
jgi:hypothetical protein